MNTHEGDKQEMTIVEEEEDDDDGPPPGFQCIITPPAEADDDDEEDGPPPGFCSIAPKPYDTPRSSEQDHIDDDDKNNDDADDDDDDDGDDEDDDDDDGPPPGWGFSSLVDALPIATSYTADKKEEDNEESDDGPPPGWELPCQMPPPNTPPLQPPSIVSSSTEIERRQTNPGNVDEVPPSESQHMAMPMPMPMPGQSSPATPPLKQPPSSELPSDAGNKVCNKTYGEKKPTSGHNPASLPQQLPPTPAAISSSSEKCQLVCGTCRKLCLYPRGAKWVQCPGCQEVNFVLEAHEVGQVKCGGCSVLLMFLHGAPAVECSSCRFVTQIGLQNRRAPLSVQQAQARAQAQAQRRQRHHSNRAR